MNLKNKAADAMTGKAITKIAPLLESLHAHLEIQSKELIRIRLAVEKKPTNDGIVEEIITQYQDAM